MSDLMRYLAERRQMVDDALLRYLPPAATPPRRLHEAMHYSVFAAGKRLRPILCMAACEAVGGCAEAALLPGIAIEILHTYTLIHDDLPAMDDDDLRRGKPTNHKVFGEANAILAGDALLTLAFEWLGQCRVPEPYTPGALVVALARAAGSQGVVGGQVADLAAEGQTPDAAMLEYIHLHKTAALIQAAVSIGAMVGGATSAELDAVSRYGANVGLAFQIADDVLNETSTPEKLGKAVKSDAKRGKVTYASLYGLAAFPSFSGVDVSFRTSSAI